jgi:hypothetical protein
VGEFVVGASAFVLSSELSHTHPHTPMRQIMDTYAAHLKGYNNTNAPLQAGWGASMWSRAAELIKHYAQGPAPTPLWPATSVQAFADMLVNIQVGSAERGASRACVMSRRVPTVVSKLCGGADPAGWVSLSVARVAYVRALLELRMCLCPAAPDHQRLPV